MEIDEGKLRIINYFVQNTPVGELHEVLRELSTILGPEVIYNDQLNGILLQHYINHGQTVKIGEDIAMINPLGQTDEGFIDPKLNKKFTIDAQHLNVIDTDDTDLGSEKQRRIQQSLDNYLESKFIEGTQGRVFDSGESVNIFIAAQNVQLANLWTGEWIANWQITEGALSGNVSIKSHYFEDGNLQFALNKQLNASFSVGNNLEEYAENIIQAIQQLDQQLQSNLHQQYDELSNEFFRTVRRAMPITRTRFSDIHQGKLLG